MSDVRPATSRYEKIYDAAVDLASVVVQSVLKNGFGPSVDEVTFVDLLGKLRDVEIDRTNRRRTARFVGSCVDVVVDEMMRFLNDQAAGMADDDVVAALGATKDLYENSAVDLNAVLQAEMNARLLYQQLAPDMSAVRTNAQLNSRAERLFGRMVREVAEYIIQVTQIMPEFEVAALSQILHRSAQITQQLSEAMQRMPRQRSQDAFTTDYLRAVVNKLDQMELFGVDVSTPNARYPLSVAYMSLDVTARTTNGASSLSSGSGDNFHQLVHGHRQILVVGEAGSGKTTLLRWLAVNSARQPATQPSRQIRTPSTTQDKVPFFIPLRRYSGKPLPRPEEFLDVVAANFTADMAPGWVQERLRRGEALVLIDGLDELSEEQRLESLEWLEALMEDFKESTYVLSSRPAGLGGIPSPPHLYQVELQPMTETDVHEFVKKWHSAVEREMTTPDERDKLANDERQLYATLSADRNIRSLAVNPLLCAMLCALNRSRDADLPTRRMDVYAASMEMLLGRRDRRRKVDVGFDLPRQPQMIILGELALWLMRQGHTTATQEQVKACIARVSPKLDTKGASSDALLGYLLLRSGILRQPAEGQIDFIHRSFQEYLAGLAAIENDEIGFLLGKATDETWREVILVAIAQAHPEQRRQLLQGLLDVAEVDGDKRVSFLAVASLQNAPEADPQIRNTIENLARALVPPRDMIQAESLAGVGDLVIEVLTERIPTDDLSGSASIRLLSMIASRDAMNLIAQIGEQRPEPGTQGELIRAWPAFDRREYARFVIARASQLDEFEMTDPDLMPYTEYFRSITQLVLDPGRLANLRSLGDRPPNLRSLTVRRRPRTTVDGIETWNGIRELTIQCTNTVVGLQPIGDLPSLEKIRLVIKSGVAATVRLAPLCGLPSLKVIQIEGDARLTTNFHGTKELRGVEFHLPEGSELEADDQRAPDSRIIWEPGPEAASVSGSTQVPQQRS